MKCSQYWFLFILIYVPTKKSDCQFVPLVEENNEKFNFSFIVEENSQVDEFMDTCPLKVLGGREINITEAPYQVAIRKKILYGYIWEAFCGGSLITMTYVVTAAHCFIDVKGRFRVLSSWRVIAGTTKTRITLFSSSSEEQWSNIKNVYKHKFYNSKMFENDLAIVEVLKPFTTTNAVKPIRLHNLKRDKEIEKGLYCSVSGFGLKENSKVSLTLNSVCVPIVSAAKCSMYFYEEYLHPSTFCAGASGKDSCQGDSGGPLVCYGVLVGVVAWGGVCGVQPGVYTRISTYTSAENVLFEKNKVFKQKASLFFIISLLLIDDFIL